MLLPPLLLLLLPLQEEVDRVLGSSSLPNMQQYIDLKYVMHFVNEKAWTLTPNVFLCCCCCHC